MPLSHSDDLTSLVLRTDFGDEGAWDAVPAALDAAGEYRHATYVSDLRFADADVQALLNEDFLLLSGSRSGRARVAGDHTR